VVAVRGIRAWRLAMEWNPAPAILHREAPCLNFHIFLKSDFTSLKLIRAYCLGLNYMLMVLVDTLSRDTIPLARS
jgi:hypothetical protein